MLKRVLLLASLWGVCACGPSIHSVYRAKSLAPDTPDMLKRIAVLAWAESTQSDAARVLARVASEQLQLKKEYLIYSAAPMQKSWSEACAEREGVLTIRALNIETTADETRLRVSGELYRCNDGALLWRSEGCVSANPNDSDLKEYADSLVGELGEGARPYAVAAFVLLKDLLEPLPSPTLSDDELMEKLELES